MTTCLIWGTPAEEMPRLGDWDHINSPRAGGEYKVVGSDRARLQKLTLPEKKRLTTWIVSQRQAGISVRAISWENALIARRLLVGARSRRSFALYAPWRGKSASEGPRRVSIQATQWMASMIDDRPFGVEVDLRV
jgi:hypothetical protein